MQNSDNQQTQKSNNMNTDAPAFNVKKPIKPWAPGNNSFSQQPAPQNNTQWTAAPAFTPTPASNTNAPSWQPSNFQPTQYGNGQPQPTNQWSQLANATNGGGSSFNPNAGQFNGNSGGNRQNWNTNTSWQPQPTAPAFNPQYNNSGWSQNNYNPNQQPMYNTNMQGGGGQPAWQNNRGGKNFYPKNNSGNHGGYQNNRGGYYKKPYQGGNQDNNSQFGNYGNDWGSGQQPNTVKIDNMQMPVPLDGSNNFAKTNAAPVPSWKTAKMFAKPGLSLKKRDPVGDSLKGFGITEDAELNEIKDLMTLIKASKQNTLSKEQEETINKMEPVDPYANKASESAAPSAGENIRKSYIEMVERRKVPDGALNMRLFLKFGELKVCQTQKSSSEEIDHCCAKIVVERVVKDTVEAIRKGGGKYDRRDGRDDRRRHNRDDGHGFEKGVAKPNAKDGGGGGWLKEDNNERAELRKKAQEMKAKIAAPKNTIQKIKLIMNRITPDNYERNKDQLRNYLFGEQYKSRDECFEEGIEYDDQVHKMEAEDVNREILETIVSNIFRKAQMEKEYIIFYGQLCEALIRTELLLRGLDCKVSSMPQSNFRKCIFDHCKTAFEKFFDKTEKAKHTSVLKRTVDKSQMTKEERDVYTDELEKAVIFQTKLFGNNEFVGELYRRRLLPQATLFFVFESLLGFSDLNDDVDDLVIEGAITLMDKIGPVLDENVRKSKKEDKQENLDKLYDRFRFLMNSEDEELISNRVKLLIKNMFANRESGWQRTKDLNKAGPKTKAQVQEEMEEKQQRERDQRDGHGDRRQDRYDNNRDRGDRDRRDGRGQRERRDTKQAQPEKKYQAKAQTKEPTQGKKKLGDKKDYFEENFKVVEISDEDLGKALLSNFNDYINKTKQLEELEADEESKDAVDDLQPSFEVFNTLKKENGRSGDDIFANLLVQAFAEGDEGKVKNSLWGYLFALKESGHLTQKDFAAGMSRFSGSLPDVALDFPQVSEYTWNYVLKPLLSKEIINLKMLDWKAPDKPKEDDDDDIEFGTEPFFKLLALLLKYFDAEGYNVTSDVVPPWKAIIKERHAKIEDADALWSEIQADVGEEAMAMIRPLLDPA